LLERGRPARLVESGVVVSNGPAFSPVADILYYSDSMGARILAYDISVIRWSPSGEFLATVALPTPNITSAAMAFPEGRGDDPQADNLFVYKPGVAGTPVTSYPH
jgi:sugar lactone lactonase YvrE